MRLNHWILRAFAKYFYYGTGNLHDLGFEI